MGQLKVDDKTFDNIINDYKNEMIIKRLSEKYNVSENAVKHYLQVAGVYKRKNFRWSKQDIEDLKNIYPSGDWDKIISRFPDLTKNKIYKKASELGIRDESYFWSEHDQNILIEYYSVIGAKGVQHMLDKEYKIKTIQYKAIDMGLTEPREWSDDELDILIKNYSNIEFDDVLKLLPKRTAYGVEIKARKLDLQPYKIIGTFYSEEDRDFIRDNYETMSDSEIAEVFGRTSKGIRDQRYKMGLYYPKKIETYNNLNYYVRSHIYDWKLESMKNCNFTCDITGQKFDVIHHLHGFGLIFDETIEELNFTLYESINSYTENEIILFLNTFKKIQNSYPLGVCLKEEVHRLFHSVYGLGKNTEEQYKQFKNDCLNGEYNIVNNLLLKNAC